MAVITVSFDSHDPQDKAALCALFSLFCRPSKPAAPTLARKRQIGMATFGYTFALPTPDAQSFGITSREVSVAVNGGAPDVRMLLGVPLQTEEYSLNESDAFAVTLVDIDQAGNRSEASDPFTGNVADDVAPLKPGQIGVAQKRQVS